MEGYDTRLVGFGEHKGLTCKECLERHPEWCQRFYDGCAELTAEEAFFAGFFLEWLDTVYRPEMYASEYNFVFASQLVELFEEQQAAGEHDTCDVSVEGQTGPIKEELAELAEALTPPREASDDEDGPF